jgi:type IV pilus assembly protein PilB
MQTQVKPKINLNFARLMRSFLRLDPDVILVGEMRDEETAKIGFDAAQTGHLVLSTLHTNDSLSSISRLLDLNVNRAQVASCLTCVLAQRLVRRICPSCIREYIPEEEEWFLLFEEYPSQLKFYEGRGCEDCGFTGYKGRTLLSEAFVVDKDISKALNNGVELDDIRRLAIEKGMLSMLDDGLLKLKDTTLSELTRVIPHEMMEMFRLRNRTQEKKASLNGALLDNSFLITDPAADVTTINRMHEKYSELSMLTDRSSVIIDRDNFVRFICESHSEICQEYRCRQVQFSIEKRDGRVDIFAISKE